MVESSRERKLRMVKNATSELEAIARNAEREHSVAHDLWTWLPSHRSAVMSHGEYAFEFQPAAADIMKEACMLLAIISGSIPKNDGEMFHHAEWFGCPCGECNYDIVDKEPLKELIQLIQRRERIT